MATSTRTVEVALSLDEAMAALTKEARQVLGMSNDGRDLPADRVEFVIEERGGDPMDRFPGTPTVVAVKVTFRR